MSDDQLYDLILNTIEFARKEMPRLRSEHSKAYCLADRISKIAREVERRQADIDRPSWLKPEPFYAGELP